MLQRSACLSASNSEEATEGATANNASATRDSVVAAFDDGPRRAVMFPGTLPTMNSGGSTAPTS
jgi:hypothetical protein